MNTRARSANVLLAFLALAAPGASLPASPSPVLVVSLATPADAAAQVIAGDPRFAGVGPQLPGTVGRFAWYTVSGTAAGYTVTVTLGWGACSARCTSTHTWNVQVGPDGTMSPAVESGDPLPADLAFPTAAGQAPVDILLVAKPACPVERASPDPVCAPRPVSGAIVVVRDATGAELTQLVSDADGHAKGIFDSGTYVFQPLPLAGLLRTPGAIAASVIPPAGVSWTLGYDTGIR